MVEYEEEDGTRGQKLSCFVVCEMQPTGRKRGIQLILGALRCKYFFLQQFAFAKHKYVHVGNETMRPAA